MNKHNVERKSEVLLAVDHKPCRGQSKHEENGQLRENKSDFFPQFLHEYTN